MLVVCKYFDHRPVTNVYEWYSLHPNKTIIDHFAIWKNATLIISTKSNLWERRRSFKNITLKVTAVKSNARSNKNKRLHGLMASLLITIAEVANFKIDIQEPEDFYGVQDLTTKKWNGVIGKLANKETDIGLGEFTPTKDRLEVTDFGDPVITSSSKYYIKKPDKHILHWSMYYKALGQTVGYVLISIILILPPIISYVELRRRNMHDSRKISNSYLKIIIDCYFDVFGIFCKMPLNNSSSLLRILTSYLAVFIPYLPFNTMEEFLNDGRYKLAIIKNTNYLELLRDMDEKASGILLDENDLPTYISQGIEMVCAGKIVLFMDHYSVTNNQTNPPCELMAFAQSSQVSMALAFTKNSPYVDYFNY
ncbi:glutamate receptor 4-like [Nasonia vitripennis]|uniref:Ionotropic glutamate receptor L-glutamate and glycine-binding domain-containing protein n=1 Tax=Nasonia vitripennis TaxID=7425 RepID=A0A7M7QJD2_NASVI|nr:glutamate receptor 4-like [Nasonia vitripennis]